MLTANRLENSVRLYTGEVGFDLPLLDVPSTSLPLRVSLTYSSGIQPAASTWNLDAPTGVAGLGWSLPPRMIGMLPQGAAAPSGALYYLVSDQGTTLLRQTGTSGAAQVFEPESYLFWKILYYPLDERWEITRQDGATWTYGGQASANAAVVFNVKWSNWEAGQGNWIGSSADITGQERFATGWYLAQTEDFFGNSLRYFYQPTEVAVGSASGRAFTQALYLDHIFTPSGEQVVFDYADKDAVEYQNPHTDPPPPNAYQDPLVTQYLSSVRLLDRQSRLQLKVQLDYYDTFLGSGNLSKRLLKAVRTIHAGGRWLPPPTFSYWGQDQNDGVSAENIYDSTTQALYGALKTVTLAEGGTLTYRYSQTRPEFSRRDAAVDVPSGADPASARFTFEEDYTVARWLSQDGASVALSAYTWDGRWIAQSLPSVPITNAAAYQNLEIESSDNLFALYSAGQLHLYYRDSAKAGRWVQPSDQGNGYYSPSFVAGEATALTVGDSFAAILGLQSGRLYRYDWNGTAWDAQPMVTLDAAGTGAVFALTAHRNYLLALTTAPANPRGVLYSYLYHRQGDGTWQDSLQQSDRGTLNASGLSLYPGDTFAAYRIQGSATRFGVLWWNDLFSELDAAALASTADSDVPGIYGSCIVLGEYLHRFNGVEWLSRNIAEISYPGQQSLLDLSAGTDKVLRKIQTDAQGTSFQYDLVQYDPQAGTWSVPAGTSLSSTDGTAGIAAPRSRGQAVSNYAVLKNALYYRQPDGSWSSVYAFPETLSSEDAATIQLLSSRYLLYQVGTGSGTVKTAISFLRNAGAESHQTLDGQQYAVSGQPAGSLVGLNAFVSYGGTFGQGGSVLTLRRVVELDCQGRQAVYPAASLTENNGYSNQVAGYLFSEAKATAAAGGYVGQFQSASVLAGGTSQADALLGPALSLFFNGLTPTESDGLDYPTGNNANAQDFYSLSKGLLYASMSFPKGDQTPASSETNYWEVYLRQLGQVGWGAYARPRRVEQTLDGVLSAVDRDYTSDSGNPASQTTRVYDLDGDQIQIRSLFTYWNTIYDPNGDLGVHLLSPVVQTVHSSRNLTQATPEVATSTPTTTWKDNWGSGSGQWAPFKEFRAKNAAPGDFPYWTDTSPHSGDANWLQTGAVVQRASNGAVTRTTDVLERSTSFLLDRFLRSPVASCFNADASAEEMSYQGFELYQTMDGWQFSLTQLTTRDFYTGTRSLKLPPSTTDGPSHIFEPGDQDVRYVFGCWAKIEDSGSPGTGTAAWTITFFNAADNQPIGTPLTIDLSNALGKWTYFQQVIDLPAVRAANGDVTVYFTIAAANNNTANACLLDDLRFSPLAATFQATVYDPLYWRLTATLNGNGQAQRSYYDAYDRPAAAVGPDWRVERVISPAYSRALTDSDTFQQAYPNSLLTLVASQQTRFFDFHDSDASDWEFSTPGWTVSDGALRYSGDDTTGLGSQATLKVQAFTNFAARLVVARQPGSGGALATVGMGNGDIFLVWSEENQRWELTKRETSGELQTLAINEASPFGEDWIYMVVDGYVLCYADGVQLFVYQYDYPDPIPADYGKLTLTLTHPGSFDDLATMSEPSPTLAFNDGVGTPLQSISLEGLSVDGAFSGQYPCSGQGVFYDAIGRPRFVRDPLTAPARALPMGAVEGAQSAEGDDTPASLVVGQPNAYLADERGIVLTYDEYIDGAGGSYDYTTRSYETSPLSRPTSLVTPRTTEAEALHYTLSLTYSGAASTSTSLAAEDDPPRYYVRTASHLQSLDAQDQPTDVQRSEVLDLAGRTVLQGIGAVGGTPLKTGFLYAVDAQGRRTLVVRQPNFYAPPADSQAADWVETRVDFFDGPPSSRTNPDSGTTEYVYDKADRLRFVLNADGAALAPQRILFRKYDSLSRVVETGYIQDPDRPFSEMPALADDEAFPIVVAANPQPGTNEAIGAWKTRFEYDRSDGPAGNELNYVGRLFRSRIRNAAGQDPDEERYAYDVFGKIADKTSKVPAFNASDEYTFSFAYNNQDQLRQLTYPLPLTGEQDRFAVGYYYDRLGRLASVGLPDQPGGVIDPDNPPTFAEEYYVGYSYDFAGRLTNSDLNNGPEAPRAILRQFSYDAAGQLLRIEDDFSSERLDYNLTGGASGVRYFDGNIASAVYSFKKGDSWLCPPSGFEYKYGYDAQGRLTAGLNSNDDAWTLTMGAGQQPAYDANGNIAALSRGATVRGYDYSDAAQGRQINDRVGHTSGSVSLTQDFEGIPADAKSSGPWSWGSNTGGPSDTGISTSQPHQGTQSLQISGGNQGHYNLLRLRTYLGPGAVYQLQGFYKTGEGYGDASGQSSWFLAVSTAAGQIIEKEVSSPLAAASDWTAFPAVSLDLPTLLTEMGLDEPPSSIALELRNATWGVQSQSGPTLWVDDLTLQGSAQDPNYSYDADGNVTAAPSGGLHQLDYDPVTGLTRSIQLRSATGSIVHYSYSADGLRTLEAETDSGGTAIADPVLSLTGTATQPLMLLSGNRSVFRILSPMGAVAYHPGDGWRYVVQDHLGSTRVVTDNQSRVSASYDYLPFGGPARSTGSPDTDFLYTGQKLDAQSELYNYKARLYDPDLCRFLAVDPVDRRITPYAYVDNNPVNLTDPMGLLPWSRIGLWTLSPPGLQWAILLLPRVPHYVTVGSIAAVYAAPWLRDYLPGLIASPLSGAAEAVGGLVRVGGGLFTWQAAEIQEGLKDVGLGLAGIVGLKESLSEPWSGGKNLPTSLALPGTLATDLLQAQQVSHQVTGGEAHLNGMHAWHAATNAALSNRLGPIGAHFSWLSGLIHESPLDWGSFWAEQHFQGTVNHILDSSMDIVANYLGMQLGLLLPRELSVRMAAYWGNLIPGPGDPDPAFGGGGHYKGSPLDAWGQYPTLNMPPF